MAPYGMDLSGVSLRSDAGSEFETKIPEFPKDELEKVLPKLNAAYQKLSTLDKDSIAVAPEQEAALKVIVESLDKNFKIISHLKWDPDVKDDNPYADDLEENMRMLAYYSKHVLEGDLSDIKDVVRELSEIFPKFPDSMKPGKLWRAELLDHKFINSNSVKGSVVLIENGTPVQKIELDIKGTSERFSR